MPKNMYWKDSRIGGGTGALDGIDGSLLNDGDFCEVSGLNGAFHYRLNATSGATADGHFVIAPAVNAGNKRWLLQDLYSANGPRKNLITNGDMRIWQRGTAKTGLTGSFTHYLADRWALACNTSGTIAYYQSGSFPTVAQAGHAPIASLMMAVTTGDASIAAGEYAIFHQVLEGYNFSRIIGRTITISFWVMSKIPGTYCLALRSGHPSMDRSYIVEYTINQADTWEKKVINVAMPSTHPGTYDLTNGQGLQLSWAMACGSTFHTTAGSWNTGNLLATANQVNGLVTGGEFRLYGVQLEIGNGPTEFEVRSFHEELELCMRYYQKSYLYAQAVAEATQNGSNNCFRGNGSTVGMVYLKVPMRVTPTVAFYSTSSGLSGKVRNYQDGVDESGTVYAISEKSFGVAPSSADYGEVCGYGWTAEAEF
jgi:hypothetical protein